MSLLTCTKYFYVLISIYRGITKLVQQGVSPEAIQRIRALPHLKTPEELGEFKQFCQTSSEKAVKGEYYSLNP